MQLLRTSTREEQDWTVVEASGQLDVATAPQLRQVLVEAQYGGASQVLLDVAGVQFIDSMGLGVLVGAHKRARSHAGAFVLAAPSERMRSLLELTGLDTVLTVASAATDVLDAQG
ncbi:STAS domain-containing protein [Egicoccus halophilus]|uniref:Anti-sigma factor antagonist n=1 Tax=Egicoccus halophilus TaxID=1670830 RepID=A0A8J3A9M7_9ACTN|nr:STAS domain-containing protein [Egicoccus halophilus]GGI07710.1 anti-sigma-B factor antagonist [Egicoccus halophilus]